MIFITVECDFGQLEILLSTMRFFTTMRFVMYNDTEAYYFP
jgi:hypothetical protein